MICRRCWAQYWARCHVGVWFRQHYLTFFTRQPTFCTIGEHFRPRTHFPVSLLPRPRHFLTDGHPTIWHRFSRKRSLISCSLRKDLQSLGAMETTLLYILHWILLDSAEECAEPDVDSGNPFHYLFSIPTMTVSIPQCPLFEIVTFILCHS